MIVVTSGEKHPYDPLYTMGRICLAQAFGTHVGGSCSTEGLPSIFRPDLHFKKHHSLDSSLR